MNKSRRMRLTESQYKIDEAREMIELVKDEEENAYDNLPENLQSGEKGETMLSSIRSMDAALSSLEDAISSIEEANQ